MSFKSNQSQQMSLYDSTYGLTEREQRVMKNSWASFFAEFVFPAIKEEPFSVLYGSAASRPSTPVNVIIGALILKEYLGLTDEQMVESLMFDLRIQYALHTTSFEEQPLSDRTFSRFRQRCLTYATSTGKDLIHDCIKDLSAQFSEFMHIHGNMKRMDSALIESNIKRLSRLELLYTCVAKFMKYLHRNNMDNIAELKGLAHYLDDADYNITIYHNKSTSTSERMAAVIAEGDKLLKQFNGTCDDVTEYQLLVRVMDEQTVLDKEGKRRAKTKEDGSMNASILQNPADPEATYRSKAGKNHKGYVANFTEDVGKNGSIITDYQAEQNTYSDSKFLEDAIDKAEASETTVTVCADGAYSDTELQQKAAEKNIAICTTDFIGKKPEDINADFKFNEDGTKVLQCPNGCTPKSCCFIKQSGSCRVSFYRHYCENCPRFNECHPKAGKKTYYKLISQTASLRAQAQRFMQTEEFKNLARIRNGVETIPSILRRKFHIDKLPVRGLKQLRFWLGTKIGALNFKKFFNFKTQRGNYAQNPAIV